MTDDVTDRAVAALENTNCTDDMQDFFQVGLVRELLAEVERLRGALDRVDGLAHRWLDSRTWQDEPSVIDRAFGQTLHDVMRGDQ